MADDRKISGSVDIANADSKYRVAYQLMHHIASREEIDEEAPRRYWLELYRDCIEIVDHARVPDQIHERPRKG